jgi:hypothetical protein
VVRRSFGEAEIPLTSFGRWTLLSKKVLPSGPGRKKAQEHEYDWGYLVHWRVIFQVVHKLILVL